MSDSSLGCMKDSISSSPSSSSSALPAAVAAAASSPIIISKQQTGTAVVRCGTGKDASAPPVINSTTAPQQQVTRTSVSVNNRTATSSTAATAASAGVRTVGGGGDEDMYVTLNSAAQHSPDTVWTLPAEAAIEDTPLLSCKEVEAVVDGMDQTPMPFEEETVEDTEEEDTRLKEKENHISRGEFCLCCCSASLCYVLPHFC